ncbi:hypothetical protein M8C13_32440 [Crossiella sp. SN42]|uniref:hypothetical protein n=1 Tax=Crossiella sp. SN42 TaxID=2944808 RepID=UPI00207C8BBB|nr:hypothetical protein [Crossiella sp. SN42]MCO1580473.1 hypothetical protein [Crossiella sp. SN42]
MIANVTQRPSLFAVPVLPDRGLGPVITVLPALFERKPLCQWRLVAELYLRPVVTGVLLAHPIVPRLSTRGQSFELALRVALTLRWTVFYTCGMATEDIAALDSEPRRTIYRRLAEYDQFVLKGAGLPQIHRSPFHRKTGRTTPPNIDQLLQEFLRAATR